MRIFARQNRRFVIIGAVLLFGVGVAAFQMVRVIVGDRETPVYSNTPPAAFAPAPGDTLVEASRLTAPRIPDDDFRVLSELSTRLTDLAVEGKMTEQTLTDAGVVSADAQFMTIQANAFKDVIAGRSVIARNAPALTSVSPTSVEFVADIDLGVTQDGGPPISGSSKASFRRSSEDSWELTAFSIGLAGSTPTGPGEASEGYVEPGSE
jgi:hypothetical protein